MTSLSMAPYVYAHLPEDHIRLLYFEDPAEDIQEGLPIRCSLRNTPFLDCNTETTPFDALSYTWGSPGTTYALLCDGNTLQIHRNLCEALPYLLRRSSKLPLWVDAVCINQADGEEKVRQIRLMSHIYRKATCVWAWLGIVQEPGAQELVNRILPRMEEVRRSVTSFVEDANLLFKDFDLPDVDSPAWNAFDGLLNNAWFSRLWIVQEATLAQQLLLLYGQHELSSGSVRAAVYGASSFRHFRDDHGRKSRHFKRLLSESHLLFKAREAYHDVDEFVINSKEGLVDVVGYIFTCTNQHKCSEPRDRVLALLGLISAGHETALQYDNSSSTASLYIQFMRFLLSGALDKRRTWEDIFCYAIMTANNSQTLPSWCPDLHICGPATDLTMRIAIHAKARPYTASTRQRSLWLGHNLGELVIRGIICDHIEAFGQIHQGMDQAKSSGQLVWIAHFHQWEEEAMNLAKPLLEGSGDASASKRTDCTFTLENYWLTLVGGRASQYGGGRWRTLREFTELKATVDLIMSTLGGIGISRYETSPSLEFPETNKIRALECIETHNDSLLVESELEALNGVVDLLLTDDGYPTPAASIMSEIWSAQEGCCIFRTSKQSLGFAKGNITRGDRLIVFNGASTAHVVRKVASRLGNAYSLVGMAYVHGIMRGELETLGLEAEDIVLV